MRLSPRDPLAFNAIVGLAFAHHNAGRYAEAAMWADKAIHASPPHYMGAVRVAIMCYVGAGRLKDAQTLMTKCVQLVPNCRRSNIDKWGWNGMRSPQLRMKMLEAFIKAGLPE